MIEWLQPTREHRPEGERGLLPLSLFDIPAEDFALRGSRRGSAEAAGDGLLAGLASLLDGREETEHPVALSVADPVGDCELGHLPCSFSLKLQSPLKLNQSRMSSS
jgi:hypothetical protein